MNIAAYVLFFLAGVGFGFAAPGRWKWLPLVFPLVLAIGAFLQHGLDATIILRLVVALVITALGVLLGTIIEARAGAGDEHPRYA